MIRKVLAISAATVLVAGCTATDEDTTPTGPIAVTATTNVWGSIAEFIGGDMVEVTSIVDQPTIDPHSYEPSARDLLSVQDAEMVLVNGGGYDSFMESLIDQSEGSRVVLRAVEGENTHDHSHEEGEDHAHEEGEDHAHEEGEEHGEEHAHEEGEEHSEEHAHEEGEEHGEEHAHEEGEEHGEEHAHEEGEEHGEEHAHEEDDHDHSHADGNEHVWYDFHVVEEVASEILASFTQLRPESAGDFQARHTVFMDELEVLEVRLEALREKALGYGVFSITPLASIMMEEAGLKEFAPSEILEAVEEERDIPPAAIADAIEIFSNPDVLMVITNDQVTDTQMQGIADAAADRGLPVVGLSELIPNEDWDYLDWMANNLDVLMATVEQALPEQNEN